MDVLGRDGTLWRDQPDRWATLDVDLRVGSPDRDSTHPLRGFSDYDEEHRDRLMVPWQGHDAGLKHALWTELEDRWREARERHVLVQGEANVRVDEEDPAADFWTGQGTQWQDPAPPPDVLQAWSGLRATWQATAVEASARLAADPRVESESVGFTASQEQRWMVDTEGSQVHTVRQHARLVVQASGRAEDGDALQVVRTADVANPFDLPDPAAVQVLVTEVLDELNALLDAPRADPWTGPVLLSGRAAAVFTHEVLGHRVEGDRQRDDVEGKTYLDMVGQPVMPRFVSIYDDPTLAAWEGVPLNGHYAVDDEGVVAQRADLVSNGVFEGFLLGRRPVPGFSASNGHGRRSAGRAPRARMGTTVVSAEGGVSDAALRRRLLDLARERGSEHAYVVEDIAGGFTLTGRVMPNAFNVRATRVRRVFVDGRPDELVRGLDLVGTPLVAYRNVVAAGTRTEVFNGMCGAESGWVPVSAVSPALLFEELEFQRKEKGSERRPLLSKPSAQRPAAAMAWPEHIPGCTMTWLALCVVLAQADEPTAREEAVSVAVQDELQRSMDELTLPEAPEIYHLRASLIRVDSLATHASFGGLVRARHAPANQLGVEVRLGSAAYDNTGLAGWRDGFRATGLPAVPTPGAVQEAAWRLLDGAYKDAVEQYTRKTAHEQPPKEGDPLAMAPLEPVPQARGGAGEAIGVAEAAAWHATIQAASEGFVAVPGLIRGQAFAGVEQGSRWVWDTDGAAVQEPIEEATVRLIAQVRAVDGEVLTDHRLWTARSREALLAQAGGAEGLQAAATQMGEALQALATAEPLTEAYTGPVVFEEEAAAELFRWLLLNELEGTPIETPFDAVSSYGSGTGATTGRRLLPRGWRVVDDPTADPSHPAFMRHDREGTPSRAVQVVQDGIARELLMSRTPRKGQATSTGHARGALWRRGRARTSLTTVSAPRTSSRTRLEKAGLRLAKSYGLDHILVVRRLQHPSWMAMGNEDLQFAWSTESATSPPPLYIEWLDVRGRRKVLRGAAFSALDRRSLRDVVLSGREVAVDVLLSADGTYGFLGPTQGLPGRVTAPEVLIGEVEVVPAGGAPVERPRLTPPPLLTGGSDDPTHVPGRALGAGDACCPDGSPERRAR